MKLLVGLGNPGSKYEKNRHNIGFMTIDEIHGFYNFSPWKKKFQSAASEGYIAGQKCLLLKPMTYMNESGRAVSEAVKFYKIPNEEIFVFHDELDIKPGKIKVKSGGGNAGHNGLKSISAHIGNEYTRIRMGIGHPGQKDIVHIYVLNNFSKEETEWLNPLINAVSRATSKLIENDTPGFTNNIAQILKPDISKDKINSKDITVSKETSKTSNTNKPNTSSDASNMLSEQLEKWRKNHES